MAEDRFPHLFLPAPPTSLEFTNPRGGGSPFRTPAVDRSEHAEWLSARLSDAWETADDRSAVTHAERAGVYLEFAGPPGFSLLTKSLEDRKARIRLLNIRTEGEGTAARDLATVYLPRKQSGYFLTKIRRYAEKETAGGKFKHKSLVESIDDIRLALLEAFWTDPKEELPGATAQWVEVWLSASDDENLTRFRSQLAKMAIAEHDHRPLLRFPERAVLLVRADRQQLSDLIEQSDEIAELRRAREPASFIAGQSNREQIEWVADLLGRLEINKEPQVAVCLLDTGINRAHPLIEPITDPSDLHAADPSWGTADDRNHGTLMAGLAAYGDLQRALESRATVALNHVLESAKIIPPLPNKTPPHLWGHVTAQGLARAEIQSPNRRRVVCLAIGAEETRDRGQPTSWSGEVDQLTSAPDGDSKRLILISAGNVTDPQEWTAYPDSNFTNEVWDPGQAWNALTVGAFTEKTRIDDPSLSGYAAIAPSGGLSPLSTTSLTWPHSVWPIKPEVVLEGGNVAMGSGGAPFAPDDLKLLSTWHKPNEAHFAPFDGTSAAVAQAAWMAAEIASTYPAAWPETIRGLIVHSADWTPAMEDQFLRADKKGGRKTLLRTCGYGVPDLARATYCLRNSLTLIAQKELQPFMRKDSGGYATKDMHLYRLPWPADVLLSLGEAEVAMRVTLSYFVEPGPGKIGWQHRYRYPSHGLRFELNSPGEDEPTFVQRINVKARDEEEGRPDSLSPSRHWRLGEQRNVGSIHSDTWVGSAAELATSNILAVRPAIGWWRERDHLNRWNKECRYSLIVSIRTDLVGVDIYTPVAIQIGIPTPIPIPIEIGET